MTSLSIRLQKDNLGTDIALAVVARIRQIADVEGRRPEQPFFTEVVVPAGKADSRRIPCEAGIYQIDVTLPSGDIIHNEQMVLPGEDADVELTAGGSPRQWLSWQSFAGIVPTKATLEALAEDAVEWVRRTVPETKLPDVIPTVEELRSSPAFDQVARVIVESAPQSSEESLTEPVDTNLDGVVSNAISTQKITWDDLGNIESLSAGELAPIGAKLNRAADVVQPVSGKLTLRQFVWPSADDPWTKLARSPTLVERGGRKLRLRGMELHEDPTAYLWTIRSTSSRAGEANRWVVIRHDGGTEIARLPIPWPDLGKTSSRQADLEIFFDRRIYSKPTRACLTICDGELGGLLSYMTAGNVASGAPILWELMKQGLLERTLRDKNLNPLAACAAGYATIAIQKPGELTRWDPWLRNLMNQFPWLPDGAIIFARRALQLSKSRAEIEEARDALKTAFKRGLPYYAAGVQHLQDGLFLFRAIDTEAAAMHQAVSKLALRLDPGQPFTVLRYPRRKKMDVANHTSPRS